MTRNWVLNSSLYLLLIGLVSQPVQAQSDFSKFRFEHVTVNDGLSHSDAMTVTQDPHGFIWVGTNKGIDRYDGYALKHYTLPINDQTGAVSNRIRALHASPSPGGGMWVGAEATGLYWFDPAQDRFVSIADAIVKVASRDLTRKLTQTGVEFITSDAYGHVWIGTVHYGVFMLTTNAQGRPATLRQVRVIPAGWKNKKDAYEVYELAVDRQQRVWIGTSGGGLWLFEAGAITPTGAALRAIPVRALPAANIRGLHIDWRDDLWVATDQQVFWRSERDQAKPTAGSFRALQRSFSRLKCLWLDSFGRLWVGTNYGLFMYEADSVAAARPPVAEGSSHTFLPLDTDPYSLSSGRIEQLLEDRFHNLWLATSAGGLSKINLQPKPFGHLRRQVSGSPTLSNNYINAICEDKKNNCLWIGTRNGFSRYDLTTKTYRDYLNQPLLASETPDVDVSALFLAGDGTLWIGTRYQGLFTLRQSNGRAVLTRQPAMPGRAWPDLCIESIAEDRFGTIWVATFNDGLYRLDQKGQFMAVYTSRTGPLPTGSLTFLLYEPAQDVLWASTSDKGLLKLQVKPNALRLTKTFGHDPHSRNGLRSTYTWPLLRDRRGTLWIGTIGGGLHRLVTDAQGQEVVQPCAHWLPETDIESLLADDSGNLWLGGGGLYQLNPATRRYLHYDVADGLQSNAFKVGAACRTADGTMYFGGTNGITYLQPRTFPVRAYPPLIQLTGLRIMNRSVALGDTINGRVLLSQPLTTPQKLRLQDAENDFSIEFVGLNYVNPRKSQYAYQLEGYNAGWVQAAPGQRSASFANLPPGCYTFRVKVRNGDGLWSTNTASLSMLILPPWWRTIWAYLIYGLVAVGGLIIYRRITTARRALESRLALETFKAEKEKEVTDLKLRFFTNVSHELRTPLTLIMGPMDELMNIADGLTGLKDKVGVMHRQTRKLVDLVNQLLDFRKVESGHVNLQASRGDLVEFLTEIFLIFKLQADEKGVAFSLNVPTEPVPVCFDRSKLESILTNLLANAFKYSQPGGPVRLSMTVVGHADQPGQFTEGNLTDNYVQISVSNQGKGLSADDMDKIFDPYYQASQTESLRVLGTGIGLSLVKQLVTRHQGDIRVDSKPAMAGQSGEVTFTFRLPFGQAHLAPSDILAPQPVADALAGAVMPVVTEPLTDLDGLITLSAHAPRILIVEDNSDVREYLQQLFEPAFEVSVAADGLEGWEKVQCILPDLVLSDIMMPRSDGLDLCRKIKQHTRTLHIPVVLLTARAAVVHELEGLELGGDDYIVKPFNPQLLYAKVTAIVQNRFKLRDYYRRQLMLEPTEAVIPDADRGFLESAMKIVEANLGEPEFSVQSLVREMGVSQSAFYRRIKSITGQSAVEFIRDVRLRRAASLLTTTSLRVSEVAAQVGFEDVKYFRQIFHKLYGQSPSSYGKQQNTLMNME